MGSDKVPRLDSKTNYTDWKRRVLWWEKATSVKPEARAATLIMNMTGKPEEVAIQLDVAELSVATGVKDLMAELDKLYETDKNQSIFTSIDSFISYRRPKDASMEEYVREFNQRYKNLVSRRGNQNVFEDGILAYFLLHHANLSETQKTLIRATTTELTYEKMVEQLKRAYGEESFRSSSSSSSTSSASGGSVKSSPKSEVKVKSEPVWTYQLQDQPSSSYQSQESDYHQVNELEYAQTEERNYFDEEGYLIEEPSEHEEVYYQHRGHSSSYRPRFRPPSHYRGQKTPYSYQGNLSGQRPWNHYSVYSRPRPRAPGNTASARMPPISQCCLICRATEHRVKDCPYNTFPGSGAADKPKKLAFFESEFQLEDEEESLVHLMGESTNMALLDTGASSTVCGTKWLTVFEESLTPEERREIVVTPCDKTFRFGDGDAVIARIKKNLPVTICGQKATLSVFVVDNDVPLLLSRESMKMMKMKIDNEVDKVYALGGEEDLVITKSGHIMIPISKIALEERDQVDVTFFVNSAKKCADHLHRYFAHGPTSKIVKFVESMQLPDEKAIVSALLDVEKSCDFCKQHKSKEKPHRKVAIPMGHKFNDVIALDLKLLNCGSWLLHMIDPVTRYAAASIVENKGAEEILTKLFDKWISVFGRPGLVMSDNGGEFVNEKFTEMCAVMNIKIRTSPSESPWCNGTVERHNGLLAEMIDAVLHETKCNLNIAVAWAVNAKNSLSNVYGFSPHQLVFGKNPGIPGLLQDVNHLPALNEETCCMIVAENLKALAAARASFVKLENSSKLKRLLKDRVQEGWNHRYVSGDQVYYKRTKTKGPWFGPAIVVGQLDNQVLLKDGGSLIRIHPCKIVLKTTADSQVTGDTCSSEQRTDKESQNQTKNLQSKRPHISECEDERPQSSGFYDCQRPHGSDQEREEEKAWTTDEEDADEDSSIQEETQAANAETASPDEQTPSQSQEDTVLWEPVPVTGGSRSIKCNDLIRFRSSDREKWRNALVVSRAGKVNGKLKNHYNVAEDERDPLCVDLGPDTFVEKRTTGENVMFIQEECAIYATCLPDEGKVQRAKEAELAKFREYNVYEEVKNIGQKTVSCRWVVTKKGEKVKARLVARGFEEMLINQVDAPTVNSTSLWCLFTVTASNNWKIQSFDVSSAFLQSEDLVRSVYVNPPAEARKSGIIWKLLKPMYGLGDSPRNWYFTLREHLLKQGCVISQLDKTLFRCYEKNKLIGLLVTHVDDVLYAGTTRFKDQVIKSVFDRFKISSEYRDNFKYLGLNIVQDEETRAITVDQKEYAESVQPAEVLPSRRRDPEDDLSESEKTSFHSVLGKLLWLAGRTRPDLSYDCMELSTFCKSPKVKNLLYLNKVVKKVRDFPSKIHFQPLNLRQDHLRLTFFSDASLGNLPNNGSSRGYVILIGNQHGIVNLLNWSSNKVKRVTHSAFAAETLACTDAVSDAIYCRQLISEILYQDPRSKVIEITGFVDNMQLYEQISSTKQSSDKKIRLDIAEIQEAVQKEINNIHWIPTDAMLADCLTKRGADSTKLARVIEEGFCDVGKSY